MSVSMSRKPGRAVHAKMRLKQKASNYIWLTTVPLGGHLQLLMTVFIKKLLYLWIQSSQEMLAKSKTRKGGLGKNEHPAGLTTRKGSSGKNGALKRTYFPGGSKTRKGDPGKNGMKKNDE
ncbi:transmembrane protein, putative [Medicago truncatula]|uniref:Transmembrane protein, putative n=1 Tax=Medicago truncatula TaxID=3880 RepID=A0A072V7Y9_MEDTR|nr:transmembrane protein, putative [Medicago truncatula]